jgi:hypothetical protein
MPVPHVLLAMQKVVGSNPISRFAEGLRLQVFFVEAVGWCVCVAGHPMGIRRLTRAGRVSEQAPLQALLTTRTVDLLHPGAERSKVRLTGPVGRCEGMSG